MKRSAFLFFKGLGLLFAILVGIGTAVLGWFDAADWINIVFYSIATSALVLWGWHHFSIRWIHSDLKQDIFSQVSKKEKVDAKEITQEQEKEDEENRVWYVGVTRTKQNLYIMAAKKEAKGYDIESLQ